jgi:DNA-directed RNA polymerase I subunit RPA1
LSRKYARLNAAEGLQIEPAILERRSDYDSDDDHRIATRKQQSQDLENTDDEENDNGDDSDEESSEDDEGGKKPKTTDDLMHTGELRAQLKRTWETDPFLLNAVFGPRGSFNKSGYDFYFIQAIAVPPSRFRPPMSLNGMSVLHSQTQYFTDILKQNETVRSYLAANDEKRAYTAWIELQTTVNCLMDSSKDPSGRPPNDVAPGIKQILERKEGLFRMNMMGKRVDYACRSVISPDPYIGTNEIGLPRYFATVLTYPTPVTDLNIKEMRDLVTRGPEQYPGARWVEIHGRRIELSKIRNANRREAIAAQLLTHLKKGGKPAIVGRQLRDGDYVLMNRQVNIMYMANALVYCCAVSLFAPQTNHSDEEVKLSCTTPNKM